MSYLRPSLRAISLVLLALMLSVPAATSLLGPAQEQGATGPVASSPATMDNTFWDPAGEYDVIITFQDPCVVERRVVAEQQGIDSPYLLASLSREHKAYLEAQHSSFIASVRELYPDVEVTQEYTTVLNGLAMTATGAALDLMSRDPKVDAIEPDYEVRVQLDDSVPLINADDMWHSVNATGSNITGKGVVVAILDTGIDYSHPDLGGTGDRTNDLANVTGGTHSRIIGGWDLIGDDADFWDGHFHGSHCAGIVGANGSVVGVAPDVSFRIYKVLSDSGSGPSSIVIAGVELAADPDDDGDTSDHSDVISMSLGGFGHPDDAKSRAVDNAVAAGAVMSVSAGNNGPYFETLGSPGCARDVISVGSTSKSDTLASSSSIGPTAIYQIKPDLTAPGVSIYSTSRDNGYAYASGTSMAAPHVSGSAALLLQSHPGWTPKQVKEALMGTAKDVSYYEYRQGAGRIDVFEANSTPMLADPPSVSLGRLSSSTNTTTFTITFENLASTWTNGTLAWSIEWEMTPLYEASGNSTDLKAMLKANTTKVNMAGGSKLDVKFTLTYYPTSNVGHHLGEIVLTAGSRSIHVPLAFYIRAPILLVDDDNTDHWYTRAPYNNHNPYYAYSYPFYGRLDSSRLIGDALSSLKVSYDVESVRTWYDGPDDTEMSQYRLVIWNCAWDYDPYGNSLTSSDLAAIKSYADGGGKIWLLGSLMFYDIYGAINQSSLPSSNAFRAVFGLGGYTRYAGTPDPVAGASGSFLSGVSWDVDTVSFGDVDYGNNLTATDGAIGILTGSTTDYWGASWTNVTSAIARVGTTNRTMFSAFEFGHITSATDRKALVEKAIAWFDLRPNGAVSYTGDLKEGEDITFTGKVLSPRSTESYVFQWDFELDGSGFAADTTGVSVTHRYADNGKFTVAMRVYEQRTATYSPLVTIPLDVVNQAPEAHIATSSPGDEASPVSFWGNATDPGGNDTFTWEWDFDYDGRTFTADSTDRNTTHTYLDDGTFTAALRVTDDEGLPSPINTTTVVVRNLPPSGNVFTPGTSYEGDNVVFTCNVEDPSPLDTVRVTWDFDYDGSFNEMANGTAVNHTYLEDGTYTVRMRMVDDDGGLANVSLQVTVRNVAPVGDFTTSAPAYEGGIVDFNGTVTDPGIYDVHTFVWDFDYDGVTLDAQGSRRNVSWQYTQDGVYTVAMQVTDDEGASHLVTKDITILNAAPVAKVTAPKRVDEGTPVSFTGGQDDPGRHDIWTYSWDFGDGGTSTEKSPVHTFQDDGVFNITLNVTDDAGDWGRTTVTITVLNVAPNATVSAKPSHIMENGTVYFQADGKDPSAADAATLTYTWNFGDGETSNLKEVVHRYVDDGCFTVTLTVADDDGGVGTYTLHVQVDNVAPSVVAKADREYISEGDVVNFTAAIYDPGVDDVHTALWDFDDGGTSTELTVSHAFLDDGNYIVVLTVTDDSGGTNTTTFRVAVSNVRPRMTATVNATEIIEGQSVSFTVNWTDPGTLDTHTVFWDFGDGTNTTETEPVHQYMQDGKFTVTVTVRDDDGGQASQPFIIEVENVAPTPTITALVTQIFENNTVTLKASATDPGPLDVVTFHWDFGDGSHPDYADDADVVHLYADNGVFRVTLRAMDGDGGISAPASVSITVNNAPPKNLKATVDLTETTVGKGVTFSAWAEDDSPEDEVFYAWNFGDSQTSTERSITHVYYSTGEYRVVLIVSDDDGGQTSWETTINVLPDMDGDGIPDEKDDDIDGDGYKNSEDDYPNDPDRHANYTTYYLILLVIVVVVVAVVAYLMTKR